MTFTRALSINLGIVLTQMAAVCALVKIIERNERPKNHVERFRSTLQERIMDR